MPATENIQDQVVRQFFISGYLKGIIEGLEAVGIPKESIKCQSKPNGGTLKTVRISAPNPLTGKRIELTVHPKDRKAQPTP